MGQGGKTTLMWGGQDKQVDGEEQRDDDCRASTQKKRAFL